jgi:hypothetical protein
VLPEDRLPPPDEPEEDGALEGLLDGADEAGGEYDGAGRLSDPELRDVLSVPLERPDPEDELDEDPDDDRPKRSGSVHERDTVDCSLEVARVRPVGGTGRADVPEDEAARPAVPGVYVPPVERAPLRPASPRTVVVPDPAPEVMLRPPS